jgi:hypothetical protein
VNPASANESKRSHCDEEPEKNSLKERPNADISESLHGESGSNQKEGDGQADAPKMLEHWIGGLENVDISI